MYITFVALEEAMKHPNRDEAILTDCLRLIMLDLKNVGANSAGEILIETKRTEEVGEVTKTEQTRVRICELVWNEKEPSG